MILNWSFKQEDILWAILKLHNDGKPFDADITYGNGAFYNNTNIPRPEWCSDAEPLFSFVKQADYTNLPVEDERFESVVFDPPFLTYIKNGRNHDSVMAKRFSGFYSLNDLYNSYDGAIRECHRVLKTKGILVFKCQDIVHNHKLELVHKKVVDMAEQHGFRVLDNFLLIKKGKMGFVGKQKHARVAHCHFLVFEKVGEEWILSQFFIFLLGH